MRKTTKDELGYNERMDNRRYMIYWEKGLEKRYDILGERIREEK